MSPLSFGLGKNLSSGGGIVTNGLVLSLDAGVSSSYVGTSAELVTNGTFETNVTGWTVFNSTNTWSSGKMQITRSGGSGATSYQVISTVPGFTYAVSAEVNSTGSRGDLSVVNGSGWGGTALLTRTGTSSLTVTLSGTFTATSNTTTIGFAVDNNATSIIVDNVSVSPLWTDLSGNGNNGTLVGGVGYNSGSSLLSQDIQGFLGATVPSGTGLDIPLETVSGTGSGATASYLASGNLITFIQILSGGNGYTQGSVLRLPVGSNPTIVLGNLLDANPVRSLTFDGTNDYVDCGNTASLSAIGGTTNITVSGWACYTTYSGGGGQAYSVMTVKGNPWTWLLENPTNTFRFRITAGGSDAFVADTSTHLLNTWYNVVGTYDGSNMRIYVNGVLKNTQAQTGTLGTNSETAKIGTYQGTNYNLTGRVSNISIYNRTLSTAEVSQNFNALRRRYGI